MQRSLCPICNQFYENTDSLNRMCVACLVLKIEAVDYVKTHHNASIAEVTLATTIPIKVLKKLIENGYIEPSA